MNTVDNTLCQCSTLHCTHKLRANPGLLDRKWVAEKKVNPHYVHALQMVRPHIPLLQPSQGGSQQASTSTSERSYARESLKFQHAVRAQATCLLGFSLQDLRDAHAKLYEPRTTVCHIRGSNQLPSPRAWLGHQSRYEAAGGTALHTQRPCIWGRSPKLPARSPGAQLSGQARYRPTGVAAQTLKAWAQPPLCPCLCAWALSTLTPELPAPLTHARLSRQARAEAAGLALQVAHAQACQLACRRAPPPLLRRARVRGRGRAVLLPRGHVERAGQRVRGQRRLRTWAAYKLACCPAFEDGRQG